MERRLAAILCADAAGYSRLVEADEDSALQRIKTHCREIIDPAVERHGGRIVKTMGDGFLAEFASAQAAVTAAVEIQSAVGHLELRREAADKIAYRMGINLGDVIFDGGDVLGDGVIVAARLEQLAEPGGICISDGVHQIVADRLDPGFRDLGSKQVKNISRPIRAWHWRHEIPADDVVLNALLATKLNGGVFLDAELTAPWCFWSRVSPEDCVPFAMEPKHIISYHFVAEGGFRFRVGEEAPVDVRSGEIVVLPHNDLHVIGSALDIPPIRANELMQPSSDGPLMRIRHGGGGERTRMVCGFLGMDLPQHSLMAALPRIMKIDVGDGATGSWIESSFRYAVKETAEGRAGATATLAKLSELLFMEAVRRHFAVAASA